MRLCSLVFWTRITEEGFSAAEMQTGSTVGRVSELNRMSNKSVSALVLYLASSIAPIGLLPVGRQVRRARELVLLLRA